MPYYIRKVRGEILYKVFDNKGIALEKKGIPKARAMKQIIAIHISKVLRGKPYDVFGKPKK